MRRLVTFFLVIPLLGAVAAPVAAQSPTTTEELLSGMVTEEVEPGVYRLVNDGVRDLSNASNRGIVAGHDGSIWLLGQNRFGRLGSDEWHKTSEPDYWHSLNVAPDGTVWLVAKREGLVFFDGESWDLRRRPSLGGR